MTSKPTRLLAAALALLLALGAPLSALAAELPAPAGDEVAQPLAVSVPDYTPGTNAGDVTKIQKGGRYTLIVLPRAEESTTPPPLTPESLLSADPLFIGSAVASDNGQVTFTDIRLRTAEASIYYVTGPGLEETPLAETAGLSNSVYGNLIHKVGDQSYPVNGAVVTLEDKDTGYAYANSVKTGSTGRYELLNLSPGEYFLHAEKPGYVPATDTRSFTLTDRTEIIQDFDISAFLGDVNGDGQRDISDLTALLAYYGEPLDSVPAGYCPDFSENDAIDLADVVLLLYTRTTHDNIPNGVGVPTAATIAVKDDAGESVTSRALTFSLKNGGATGLTFTAANVTLTFRTDYIQPINQNGGAVNPANPASAANCLMPRAGVTVSDANWTITGDRATLTFSFFCDTPTALTDLVDFRYRLAPGKTLSDLFDGVFTLGHVAAQVGTATVLTGDSFTLEYPQSATPDLDSITIDQADAELTIPTEGRTAVLALSATGHKDGEEPISNLSGVTWDLADAYQGVSISNSLLTVTHAAQPGEIKLTASLGNVTSDPLTVTLKNAPLVPSRVSIVDSEGATLTSDALAGPAGTALTAAYQAQVVDQYGALMDGQAVTWSLSGAPNGVSVSEDGGVLSVADALPAGTYSFSLHAGLDSYNLRATAIVTLTLEPELASLVLSGPASAQIPSGMDPLTLRYVLSAKDAQGNPMPTGSLSLSFTATKEGADPDQPSGVSATVDMTGNLTVTVDATAQPGEYALLVSEGDGEVTATFTLTLKAAQEDSATLPVRAALSYNGEVSDTLAFTLIHTDINSTLRLTPVLLNRDGLRVDPPNQNWELRLSADAPGGMETSTSNADGHIDLDVDALPCGVYLFTVTAHERTSGLQVTVPVKLTLVPKLTKLTLRAPETLSIPTDGDLRYTIAYTAEGSDGKPMAVTDRLTWTVTGEDGKEPAGVSMLENQLTISPSAKPGQITVSVFCDENGDGKPDRGVATHDITLERTGTEKVLALRRDGVLLTGGVDATYGKEGQAITMAYTPVLLDPTTGEATEISSDKVTWVGAQGSFTVEAAAEPGVYTAPITVIHQGQSVSLTAQVTVYPDIQSLYIAFDNGDTDKKDEQYRFDLPILAAKTYHGTLMAKITRAGNTVTIPFSSLNLTDYTDYDIEIYTPLTGIYTVYDKATGRFTLTVDPAAEANSMKNPDSSKGETETRYLRFTFSYYPGQEEYDQKQLFVLSRDTSSVASAVLRQGTGVGSKFIFETTRGDVTLNADSGVLSNCYALELLDQYGNPVTDQYVYWPSLGSPYITLVDPDVAVTKANPRYQSIRRLRVAPDTPQGTYPLTITASCGPTESAAVNDPTFTRSIKVDLHVSGEQKVDSVTLTGVNSMLIPKYYIAYNQSTVNNETTTTTYSAVAQDRYGNELNASLCDFEWRITTATGGSPAGVTLTPDPENPAAVTITVNRHAQPTGPEPEDQLKIIVTATPKGSTSSFESVARLALTRGALAPTLMTINGDTSHKIELDGPNKTVEYTFDLWTQYNTRVSDLDASTVKWTVSANKPNFVTVDTSSSDRRGYPSATVTIRNPGIDTKGTFTLTAAIVFTESNTSSGKATVFASRTVTVTVGNPATGGLGGELLPEEVAPSNVSSATPSTSKSGTTGTATLSKEEADALTTTTATGTLTIAPTGTSGLTSITTVFPASLPKAIAAKSFDQSLRIQTALGTVTIPKAALRQLGTRSGNISVTILNQNGTVSVSFRAGGSAVSGLSGQILLQAPVNGNTVLNSQNQVIKKAVVTNGQIATYITGDTQFKIETRGKVFSDTQNSWAKDAVTFVTARELFQGTSATTFNPNGNMTRGMVVTVLHRLEDTPVPNAANLFQDVPNNTWYTDAVTWANSNGIVQGTGKGFLPNDPVSREQLATILYRYMSKTGYNTSKRSSLTSFSDSGKVSSWARDAMEWAVSTGLLTGKPGGKLDPGGNASRAEVATILERLVRAMAPSV